jgi:hypothetical protein
MVIRSARCRRQACFAGFVPRRKTEYFFARQKKWPFLNPTSEEYDCTRWTYNVGDSDFF